MIGQQQTRPAKTNVGRALASQIRSGSMYLLLNDHLLSINLPSHQDYLYTKADEIVYEERKLLILDCRTHLDQDEYQNMYEK